MGNQPGSVLVPRGPTFGDSQAGKKIQQESDARCDPEGKMNFSNLTVQGAIQIENEKFSRLVSGGATVSDVDGLLEGFSGFHNITIETVPNNVISQLRWMKGLFDSNTGIKDDEKKSILIMLLNSLELNQGLWFFDYKNNAYHFDRRFRISREYFDFVAPYQELVEFSQ